MLHLRGVGQLLGPAPVRRDPEELRELVAVAIGGEEDRPPGRDGDLAHRPVGERGQLLGPAAVDVDRPEVELAGDVGDEEDAAPVRRELGDGQEAAMGEELLEGRALAHEKGASIRSTAAPRTSPRRRRSSASFACSSGNSSTWSRPARCGASAEELHPVLARQIRDRADDPLVPEQLVGEGRDVAHVDPRADEDAAAGEVAERRGHELARRREDDRRVELLRRRPVGGAGPLAAELPRERGGRVVAGADEAEQPPPLVACDLRDDVRGRAEPVEARAAPRPRPAAAPGTRSARRRAAVPPACPRSPPAPGSRSARRPPRTPRSRRRGRSR